MECKICGEKTQVQFNINKRLVPVCKNCSTSIFLQQSKLYAANKSIFDLPRVYKKNTPRHPEIAAEILNFLNTKLGNRKMYSVKNIPDVFLQQISARVEEGHSLLKMKAVVHLKYNEWSKDEKMKRYLRPSTLFNKEKFNNYVLEIPEDYNPDNTKKQRLLLKKLSNFGVRGVCNKQTDEIAKELIATGYSNNELLNTYLINKI